MAFIEFNALSVYLGGSFTTQVFFPEPENLMSDEKIQAKTYRALYLIHDDGGDASDWTKIQDIEEFAREKQLYIIAPSIAHSFCRDMDYGPEYEKFLAKELPGICRHMFPISRSGEDSYIGGCGTGAYGAFMLALRHPDTFSKCIVMNGQMDMAAMCEKAADSKEETKFENPQMLAAIFGDLKKIRGGINDAFAAACTGKNIPLFITCEKESSNYAETMKFSKHMGIEPVIKTGINEMLKGAINWL